MTIARLRDLALFDLGIDSKLRACDLVKLRVRDVCHGDRWAARARVLQQETQRPIQCEITPPTREAPEKPRLVLAARRMDALRAVATQCEAAGAESHAVRCDVRVEADCRALATSAVARFVGIDVLVNDAGISGHGRLEDVTDFGWYEEMMRVNYMGTVWCTRYALAELRRSKGLIVGIPGITAKVGVPEHTALTASKSAQAGFLEALRTELVGTGVDVTAAFPALVATDIRKHSFGPDGKLTSVTLLNEGNIMPVAECARQIIAGMRARKRELLMTPRAKLVPWLKLLAPEIVQKMARAAVRPV